MFCPPNPTNRLSEVYNQLLKNDTIAPVDFTTGTFVDRLGSPARLVPDGIAVANPCRQITDSLALGSNSRWLLIQEWIYENHRNTNRYMVRGEPLLDGSGNLRASSLARIDRAKTPASVIPLLGDGLFYRQIDDLLITLLPLAVLRTCATARSAECKKNLKQIGLAMHLFAGRGPANVLLHLR